MAFFPWHQFIVRSRFPAFFHCFSAAQARLVHVDVANVLRLSCEANFVLESYNVCVQSASELTASVHATHAQTCDVTRVQSATQSTGCAEKKSLARPYATIDRCFCHCDFYLYMTILFKSNPVMTIFELMPRYPVWPVFFSKLYLQNVWLLMFTCKTRLDKMPLLYMGLVAVFGKNV